VVPIDVLRTDEGRFGTAPVAPPARAGDRLAVADDAVEEVVGREEDQVAAEVAVASDRLEFAG